jgi:hypothetical protein
VSAWTDERARLPIDPELGPSWHLGVAPLEDNGTAITLVASHIVADGLGICGAIADAVAGRTRDFGYPSPGSRTRIRALTEDLQQTAATAPEMARALAGAARLARRHRHDFASSIASALHSRPTADGQAVAAVPALTAYIDLSEWDARAKALGGTSNSLFAGFASRLGVSVGRIRDDGAVTLSFPGRDRAEHDSRGNALTTAVVTVDPTRVTSDLSGIRVKTKRALVGLAEKPSELRALLPLTPVIPKRLARKLSDAALHTAELPIGCSNIGAVDPSVNCPDGTDADYFAMRLIDPAITKSRLDHVAGQLFLVSGRVHGKVFITVFAYRVGGENSKNELHEVVSRTLADFTLSAVID